MSSKPATPTPEFSHPLAVEKISAAGTNKTLDANDEERRRLAARFDLLELPKLHAELTIKSARAGKAFAVTGSMTADVVQKCVVTLEPVPAHIEHEIEMIYTLGSEEEGSQGPLDPDEVETEPVTDGVIDLGELVAQSLGSALDPWPRKPGVAFQEPVADDTPPAGPLAKLLGLKKKKK